MFKGKGLCKFRDPVPGSSNDGHFATDADISRGCFLKGEAQLQTYLFPLRPELRYALRISTIFTIFVPNVEL